MLLAALIVFAVLGVSIVVLSLCRAAAAGDRHLEAERDRSRRA